MEPEDVLIKISDECSIPLNTVILVVLYLVVKFEIERHL